MKETNSILVACVYNIFEEIYLHLFLFHFCMFWTAKREREEGKERKKGKVGQWPGHAHGRRGASKRARLRHTVLLMGTHLTSPHHLLEHKTWIVICPLRKTVSYSTRACAFHFFFFYLFYFYFFSFAQFNKHGTWF